MACWSHCDVMEHLAVISVVGDGMRTLRGISAKFFCCAGAGQYQYRGYRPGLFRAFYLGGGEITIRPPPACAWCIRCCSPLTR